MMADMMLTTISDVFLIYKEYALAHPRTHSSLHLGQHLCRIEGAAQCWPQPCRDHVSALCAGVVSNAAIISSPKQAEKGDKGCALG